MRRYLTHSPEETIALGCRLGEILPDGTVVSFDGDLAAGKTTLIKGIALGAAGIDPDDVVSPTFVYLNIYEGGRTVYHFDLYRLEGADAFLSMGFDDAFAVASMCCIEWADRVRELLPPDTIEVIMEHHGEGQRLVTIKGDVAGFDDEDFSIQGC